MSLDYDLTGLKDRDVHFPADEHGLMADALHALIFTTMAVEIGEITEDNWQEFDERMRLWTTAIGPLFYTGNPHWVEGQENPGLKPFLPYVPTSDDVRNAIGLKTNVATEPRAHFMDKVQRTLGQSHFSKDAE